AVHPDPPLVPGNSNRFRSRMPIKPTKLIQSCSSAFGRQKIFDGADKALPKLKLNERCRMQEVENSSGVKQSLCLLCLRRASALISSCSNFESVAADLFQDYEAVRHFLPEGVCQGCRRVLSSLRSLTPRALPPRPDYEKIIADMKSLPPATRSRPDCNCQLCEMARGNHHKGSDPKTPYTTGPARAPPGRPRERSPAPAEGATAVLSCSYCHSPVGRGKQHKCNSTAKVTNIEQTVSPRTREMLASNCIAEKTGGSTADSNSITLARHRGGHPIRVAVHVAQNSSASFPPTRTDTMMHLKTTLNLSNNQVLQAAQVLRAGASSSRAVESNLKKILVQQNRALEDYFDIQNLQFSELTSTAATADTICRPTVVCNDSVKLIAHVAQQRSFNDFHCLLGLDGGGGFFKVCVSIIGSNAKPEIGTRGANSRKFCDTGVKKILRILLDNGLLVLLIHEPDDANLPTVKRRKSTVEPLDAMVEVSAILSADEDYDEDPGRRRRRRRRNEQNGDGENANSSMSNSGIEVTTSEDADNALDNEDDGPSDYNDQSNPDEDAQDSEVEAVANRERGDRDGLAEARRSQRVRTAKLSAAAVCVGSGNAQDDPDLPGLAHCLEHMVFMGSAKYPDENGFDAFVQECGGSSNAWTDAEQTLFYFSVRQQSLPDCLDRFAHLLGKPLLLESSLEREVQAVHSEFELACTNVDSQMNFFHNWLAGTGHPMGGFKSGNRFTLWERPRERGIDVRQRLEAYWRRHYTAGNMRLAVQSRIGLDELEATVRESFACLQPGQPEPRSLAPPFANCDKFHGRVYKLLPAKDMDRLRLAWPGPPARLHDQPHRLLAICLAHEGPGSVLDCLRRAGLAAELWAGVRNRGLCDNPAASLFEVGVRLTPAGLRAWERIVRLIYAYIGLMGQRLNELARIYAERRRIWRTAFRFQEEDEPADSVEFASCNMHRLQPEMWLMGDRIVRRFNPEAIEDYRKRLRPRNCCILLTSRSYGPICDQVTDGPAVRFAEHRLSEATMADWELCVTNPDTEMLNACRLHLPLPNQFVSEQFNVPSPGEAYREMGLECVPEYPVRLLVGDPAVDRFGPLFYYKDRKFKTPRAVVRVSLDSPVICESLENSTLVHLWLYMFDFQLSKELYAAVEAYLWYEVLYVEPFSIRIRVEGYNDKLFVSDSC
uniref:Peptidase_M16 domain-containing protein n=1 Tax=Macrostomum lignano TaxID=282301 RepID=A0A1I8GZV3_9PLAT